MNNQCVSSDAIANELYEQARQKKLAQQQRKQTSGHVQFWKSTPQRKVRTTNQ